MVDEVVLPQDRLLPQNVEAEEAVLGSLIIDPRAITKVSTFLRPLDFYQPQHVEIFEAMVDLYGQNEPSDILTLSDNLNRRGQLDRVGGLAYLNQLANAVPTSINVEHYGHIVERLALLRRLVDAGSKIATVGYEQANSQEEALEKAETLLFEVSRDRLGRDFLAIKEILNQYFEKLDWIHEHRDQVTGVPTGFVDLDKLMGGLQPSDLVILAARPAMGKSSLAMNIAHEAASKHGLTVGVFSLEMSGEQLVQRLLSMEAEIDSTRLRTGFINEDEWDKLTNAIGRLSEVPIYIEDSANISVAEMRSKARRLHMERSLDLIIVDYLQLMHGRNQENRVQEISEITRALKGLARDLNIPVLALSQLSRAPDQRPNHEPMLSDLRESGSIEQDADVVMFIYRDKVYNPQTDQPNVAKIIIAKHRNGPVGAVNLYFKEAQTLFADFLSVPGIDDDGGYYA